MAEANWYKFQVSSGNEDVAEKDLLDKRTIALVRKKILSITVQRAFIPAKRGRAPSLQGKIMFPGLIFVYAVMDDKILDIINGTKCVVKSTDNFENLIPLTEAEVSRYGLLTPNITNTDNFWVGDKVKVVDGAFTGYTAKVASVNFNNRTVTIRAYFFGSPKLIELNFSEVDFA